MASNIYPRECVVDNGCGKMLMRSAFTKHRDTLICQKKRLQAAEGYNENEVTADG